MRVIAIDPGVISGYCYAEIDGDSGRLEYYPFQVADDIDDLWRRLEDFQPRYIVMEDFESRRGSLARGGLNLFPVQLIGVARLYSLKADHQCAVYLQKASTGKQYYTNPVLKQLGLYVRAVPHGMDASRHLLQWCMFGAGNQFIGQQSSGEFATILDGWEG